MKRFYKEVTVQEVAGGYQVTLDGRGIKTVKGAPQIAPTAAFAEALAAEWAAQGEELDPQSFVLRDMADYALDLVAENPGAVADKVLAYGDTDTLLYRADPDEPLYERQQEVWEPIVTAFEARMGVELTRISGIMHRPQSPESLATLCGKLAEQSPFALAALETLASLAASLIIALSAKDAQDEAQAITLWRAASLEEEWQVEQWGCDEEAEERRVKRQAAFLSAYRALRMATAA